MIHDLSIPLSNQTPVYPGDPPLQVKPAGVLAADGFQDHTITMGTHNGTHLDAPAHMIEGGATLGAVPLETFVGRGRLVEGFSVDALQAAGIGKGDIVLFQTGMGDRLYDEAYFTDYPAMDMVVADWLVATGVKMIGVDAGSVDNLDDFPIHKRLLGAGVIIIENLTGLEGLANKDFEVYALPLKFDLDGSPARVIAVTRE